jgi:Ca2+-binding RTX toxin-like protein
MKLRVLLLLVALILLLLIALAPAWGQEEGDIICEANKVCLGTGGDDTIWGTEGDDNIRPQNGDDTVYALGGNDQVGHSGGNDYIEGGDGADTLRGGFGLDTIYGNEPSGRGDAADGDQDLIDCAYVAARGGEPGGATGADVGYGGDPEDIVVDCSNV